jgi:hypothetical protein
LRIESVSLKISFVRAGEIKEFVNLIMNEGKISYCSG